MKKHAKGRHKTRTRLYACLSFFFLCTVLFLYQVDRSHLPEPLKKSAAVMKVYDYRDRAMMRAGAAKQAVIEPAAGEKGYTNKDRRALERLIGKEAE